MAAAGAAPLPCSVMKTTSPRRYATTLPVALVLCLPASYLMAATPVHLPESPQTTTLAATPAGQPLTPAQLQELLPEKVYFQGQSAPLQVRNAGAVRFAGGAVVFAALVDTSGYSTAVQQKYQFYLVTETDIRFGGQTLHPGAYGAGFIENDRFVVMDIGGHTLAEGATANDSAFARPRPLQMRAEKINAVRLYLGRRFVLIEAAKP